MNVIRRGASDRVVVTVFKDNLASRNFKVSLSWITKLGVILGLFVALTVLMTFFTAKYYHAAHQGDPSRVRALEQELSDLKISYDALQKVGTPSTPIAAPTAEATPPPSTEVSVKSAPISTSAVLFTALPQNQEPPVQDSQTPISITSPKITWSGKTLKVRFAIQYTGEEKGSQQGRIVILARGPESLMAHPPGIFKSASEGNLLSPSDGEYFSVSRIREVKADFGPMSSNQALREVEVLLFNSSGRMLVHQVLKPETGSEKKSGKATSPMETETPGESQE